MLCVALLDHRRGSDEKVAVRGYHQGLLWILMWLMNLLREYLYTAFGMSSPTLWDLWSLVDFLLKL
jgi:hypothetical protein